MDTVRIDRHGCFMARQEKGAPRVDKHVGEVASLSMLDAWLAEPVIALVVGQLLGRSGFYPCEAASIDRL
jgi:hypothetical protein